jgi:hypothetical protein
MNFNDKTAVTESEILCGWSKYVIELATPLDGITFDYDFKTQVDKDVKNLNKLYSDQLENLPAVSLDTVKETVRSLKNGKAPDEFSITAEHLKYGSNKLLNLLVKIVNFSFENLFITPCLKSRVACPILKKGKLKQDPNSYRKITIAALLGIIIEKIHLNLNSVNVSNQQNRLQKGFTRGEMPITAGLILSELMVKARNSKTPLYIAFMDARYIESNTGKSARQGNLRHPRGCRRFPCFALFTGV